MLKTPTTPVLRCPGPGWTQAEHPQYHQSPPSRRRNPSARFVNTNANPTHQRQPLLSSCSQHPRARAAAAALRKCKGPGTARSLTRHHSAPKLKQTLSDTDPCSCMQIRTNLYKLNGWRERAARVCRIAPEINQQFWHDVLNFRVRLRAPEHLLGCQSVDRRPCARVPARRHGASCR